MGAPRAPAAGSRPEMSLKSAKGKTSAAPGPIYSRMKWLLPVTSTIWGKNGYSYLPQCDSTLTPTRLTSEGRGTAGQLQLATATAPFKFSMYYY
jgi:hypothetical protein